MIQILYSNDHMERGMALSQAVGGAQSSLVTTAPTAKPGLDTLVFWGHGDILRLCGLLAKDMVDLIRKWRDLNSGLKTVEIVTCNTRHAPAGHDPYAKNVLNGMRTGFRSKTRDITVKALPVNVGGSVNAFSILLAHAPNKSWCYVTGPGPDDKIMFQGSNLVKAEAIPLGSDLARGGDLVARNVKNRRFTLNFGYFNTLRAQLGVVS